MNYKQQSSQGCLVVDLMYLFGIEPTRQNEKDILSEGLFRLRDNYTLGCLLAFLDRYEDNHVTVYVDNNYYLNILQDMVSHPRIKLFHRKNDQSLLNLLDAPYIVYVDNYITDEWTHLPHFVMVVGSTQKFYEAFDPWEGKVSKISKAKLLEGIKLLRTHIRVCPFVITSTNQTQSAKTDTIQQMYKRDRS